MLIGDAIESGMVGINAVTLAAPDAPFGGVKESGFRVGGWPRGPGGMPGDQDDSPGVTNMPGN